MNLIQELIRLTFLLLFLICALLINLSFFSDHHILKSDESKKTKLEKPFKTVKNQLGKQLFKWNCAACHNRNMRDDAIGPALGGVRKRWEKNETEIYDFIQNSRAVIKGGDQYAVRLFKEWAPNEMPAFNNLRKEEMDSILNYIEEQFAR